MCAECSEIFAGSVFLFRNDYLCFDDTIEWKDILSGEGAEIVAESNRSRPCECSCVYFSVFLPLIPASYLLFTDNFSFTYFILMVIF